MKRTRPSILARSTLLLLIMLLSLTACKPQTQTDTTYQTVPQVTSKYSADEIAEFNNRRTQGKTNHYESLKIPTGKLLSTPSNLPKALFYDSGVNIAYPEQGVKGIYLTAQVVADKTQFEKVLTLIRETGLNSVVIDFKDDYGQIVTKVSSSNPMIQENSVDLVDLKAAIKRLEQENVYPIARIVTFKDDKVAQSHPELSFHSRQTGAVWSDDNGSQFTNPFLEDVWKYNVDIAIEAAKLGFKEIQYDYVRFPEGFETFAEDLRFDKGNYENYVNTSQAKVEGEERVAAIMDFIKYSKEHLAPYGVKVGADVFGITAITAGQTETTGIGQDFPKMAEELDVISSMIYPSHWGNIFFGIEYPDLHPYELVDEYMYSEEVTLKNVQNKVIRRPWLQDFTAHGKTPGTYQEYDAPQVQAQIDALMKHGIHEFYLWNANAEYSKGVDYMPEKKQNTQRN